MAHSIHTNFAFSEESRGRNGGLHARSSGFEAVRWFPCMAECYDWLIFNTSVLFNLPVMRRRRVLADTIEVNKIRREFATDSNHIGIVYEYIEDGENGHDVVQNVVFFLHLEGFYYDGTRLNKRNWRGGVLVDHSDIAHPGGSG